MNRFKGCLTAVVTPVEDQIGVESTGSIVHENAVLVATLIHFEDYIL